MALRVVLVRIMDGRGEAAQWEIPTRMVPPGVPFQLGMFAIHLPNHFTRDNLLLRWRDIRCPDARRMPRSRGSTEIVTMHCSGTLRPIRNTRHLPDLHCMSCPPSRRCALTYSCELCASSFCQDAYEDVERDRFSEYLFGTLSPLLSRMLKRSIPFPDAERGRVNTVVLDRFPRHLLPREDAQ